MHTNSCGLVRVGRWSSASARFMGFKTGNTLNNNAQRLKNRAKKVSCFRTGVPIINEPPHPDLFYINGPVQVCENQLPPVYKIVFNETAFPNAQFLWETSPNGLTEWSVPSGLINNGYECILPSLYTLPDLFFLRVTVTGSNGHVDSDILMISKLNLIEEECINGQGGSYLVKPEEGHSSEVGGASLLSNTRVNTQSDINSVRVFPNPTKGILLLRGLKPNCQISVMDLNGRTILSGFPDASLENGNEYNIDLKDLPAGLYFLKVRQSASTIIKKIIKQ